MGRREELSDFTRGTVIGCHLCHKSVREISALLDLPRSTVSYTIVNWKRLGATTAQPRSGRPRILTEQGRRVLMRVARKNRPPSIASLTAAFQTASGRNISKRTVRRELHGMGFHGRGAAQCLLPHEHVEHKKKREKKPAGGPAEAETAPKTGSETTGNAEESAKTEEPV